MEISGPAIAARIKQIRLYRGIKQDYAASILEMTQQSYSLIESNQDLRLSTILNVSKMLDVNPLFIMAVDIPINDATINRFQQELNLEVFNELEKCYEKIDFYKGILGSKLSESLFH